MSWALSKKHKSERSFLGSEIVLKQIKDGTKKKRVGIKPEKIIAREGSKIFINNEEVGVITSGGFGPSVNGPIAMGYIKTEIGGIRMSEKKYSKKHEWVELEGDVATVGITAHAAKQLGDIVFTEVPDKGKKIEAGNEAAVVESVKAASDVYSPIGGEVVETNSSIVSDPSLVNKDPENAGWFFKIKVANKSEIDTLMNKNDYEKYATENPN